MINMIIIILKDKLKIGQTSYDFHMFLFENIDYYMKESMI